MAGKISGGLVWVADGSGNRGADTGCTRPSPLNQELSVLLLWYAPDVDFLLLMLTIAAATATVATAVPPLLLRVYACPLCTVPAVSDFTLSTS